MPSILKKLKASASGLPGRFGYGNSGSVEASAVGIGRAQSIYSNLEATAVRGVSARVEAAQVDARAEQAITANIERTRAANEVRVVSRGRGN